jgi:hypothetical protein
VDRNVVGIRALAGLAAIAIAGGAAGSGQIMHGGTASAAVEAVSYHAESAAVSSDVASRYAASRGPRAVATPVDVPAGWTSVTSPWLGYSVTLPEAWGLLGHVTAADSRTPHDIFAGTVTGAQTPTTLVIGSCPTADATIVGTGAEVVTADGRTFDVSEPQAAGAGRTTMVATSVAGDTTWYLTACMADDAASQAVFRAMVASFRFPSADVPRAEASPPAP